MQFTKQDIKKISQQLAKTAVKDSQFKELNDIEQMSNIAVPVIQDGSKNKRIPVSDFVRYIDSALLNGVASGTLSEKIRQLIILVGNGIEVPAYFGAENVTYDMTEYVADSYNVKQALDHIIGILYGTISLPMVASASDIVDIFNQN